MPTDPRSLLQRGAPTRVAPFDPDTLRRRTRQRKNRRRATLVAGAALTVFAVVAGGVALVHLHDHGPQSTQVAVTSPPSPGSADMPATFITVDENNEVDVVDADTGRTLRTLLAITARGESTQAVAASSTEAYVATYTTTDPQILRIPRSGGTPTVIAHSDALALALSPDGTRLAWVDGVGSGSEPLLVSVDNLRTGTNTAWSLNAIPHGPDNIYQPAALTWSSNDQLALLTSSISTRGCGGDVPLSCIPKLTVINTSSQSSETTTRDVPIPNVTGAPGLGGVALGFLAAGPRPDTLLVAARFSDTAPDIIYQLTLDGTKITTRPVASLPPRTEPTSLDPSRHDLLLLEVSPGPIGTGYLARTTNYGPPTILARHDVWFHAVW
jgi:hypothetical protein